MTTGKPLPINEREFELLTRYINENSGIVIPPEKSYLIETRLSGMMASLGMEAFGELYDYIVRDKDPILLKKVINAITTNETMWFRDGAPWKVLEERILPQLVKKLGSGEKNRARMWFSAASTGQEPYSTVMCVDDYLYKNRIWSVTLENFDFIATDISSGVLDTAKKGRYDQISITRGLDEYYKNKYFTKNGPMWELDGKIREAVRFFEFNLQRSFHMLGRFDVIFCRYVMIYFSESTNREIVGKMHNALADGGVLFTGNYVFYELFEGRFDTCHYGNLTYYTKKKA